MDLNLLMTLVMLALCILALFLGIKAYLDKKDLTRDPFAKFTDNRMYYTFTVSILLLLAVILRVYLFGSVPAGVNQDEALAAVDANALALYGTDRFGMSLPVHFTGWGYGQMSVLLSYLMIPFIKIFGLSVFAARLPILIVSLISIWVLYKFSEKLFGKMPAVIALAFIAIAPWHMMQSRWAIDCNMLPHFLLFSVYFLYLGLSKRRYLYISMVFFALTMYTYGIAWYSIPVFLLILCIYLLITKKINIFEALQALGIYLLVAWPIFGVMINNFFKLETFSFGPLTIPYFANTTRADDILFFAANIPYQLGVNARAFVDAALLQNNNMAWNSIPAWGATFIFSIVFFILGLGLMIKKLIRPDANDDKHLRAGAFILIAWIFVSVLSGLIIKDVNINRINIIFYPMIIMTCYGIYYTVRNTSKLWFPAITIIIAYSIAAVTFTGYYFGENAKIIEPIFFKGFEQAVQGADRTNADVIYVTNYTQYDNAYHVSEVLNLFYNKIDPLYFQDKKIEVKNGKTWLTYKSRYHYVIFDNNLRPSKNAAYVFNVIQKDLFNEKDYNITISDGYGFAVPK